MNGGNGCGNGRGRGFGDRGNKHAESNEEDDPEEHWNDDNQHGGHYVQNHPNEERFGKLNSASLSLMVDLILKLISHES
jgi:hypothetical protein